MAGDDVEDYVKIALASIVEGLVLGAFYPVLTALIDPFIVAVVYFLFTGATIYGLVKSFDLDMGLTPLLQWIFTLIVTFGTLEFNIWMIVIGAFLNVISPLVEDLIHSLMR